MSDYPREECGTCQAPIIWASHERTRGPAPIDAEPVVGGTIQLFDGPTGIVGYRILKPEQVATKTWGSLHTNHFATCRDAPAWRRKT